MPFKSMAQSRAAFGGYLGPEMKKKAKEWAKVTDYMDLPDKKKEKKKKKDMLG
jgi:hypothetical protein